MNHFHIYFGINLLIFRKMNIILKIIFVVLFSLLFFLLLIFYGQGGIFWNENFHQNRQKWIFSEIHRNEAKAMEEEAKIVWRQENEYANGENLTFCPEIAPGLKGKIDVDFRIPEMEEIEREYPGMDLGGHWRPKNCTSQNRVAIIIPYRDRQEHLRGFLHHLHGIFQRQQLDYAIFVVEQIGNLTFNRGRLINIGFLEAEQIYPWECFAFHDIDSLPENDQNIYSCPTNSNIVKHMIVGYESNGYKLLYETYFSGAIILRGDQFRRTNGFSNDYWGWGGEDDDFYTRVKQAGMSVWRNSPEIARYKHFKHQRDGGNPVNPCRWKLLGRTKSRQRIDGLGNLRYRVESMEFNRIYTHLKVDILEGEFEKWKEFSKTLRGC